MKVGALAGALVAAALAGTLWTSTYGTHHHAAAPTRTAAAPKRLPTLAEGFLPCSTKRTAALTAGLAKARADTQAALAGVHAGTLPPATLTDAIGDWMTAARDARQCLGPRAAITQNRAIGRVLLQIGG